ncbi:MAG: hypothetical protein K2G10_00405, partial [Alistipes sp.]|nr:hypothetical protein [Alistipes sp.]
MAGTFITFLFLGFYLANINVISLTANTRPLFSRNFSAGEFRIFGIKDYIYEIHFPAYEKKSFPLSFSAALAGVLAVR